MDNKNEELTLTPPQQRYLDWLCTAPSERVPNSKAKLCLEMDVAHSTLMRWEKKGVFLDQWKKSVDDIQGSPERTQRLLDTLYASAITGDTKSAQLYLQATNRMLPPTVTIQGNKRAAELTDDELDSLIAAVANREKTSRVAKLKVVV